MVVLLSHAHTRSPLLVLRVRQPYSLRHVISNAQRKLHQLREGGIQWWKERERERECETEIELQSSACVFV